MTFTLVDQKASILKFFFQGFLGLLLYGSMFGIIVCTGVDRMHMGIVCDGNGNGNGNNGKLAAGINCKN